MSNCITTYTGKHFDPVNPNSEKICIRDIAHALSLICRGNGHVSTFFSVGQHCIVCAEEAASRGLSGRMVLACLLHDASECYMSDVPRPFKRTLTEYQKQEEILLDMIYRKYLGSSLSIEEKEQVKEIDDALLWYDLRYLLNETDTRTPPEIHIPLCYEEIPFKNVEEKYLQLFYKYRNLP